MIIDTQLSAIDMSSPKAREHTVSPPMMDSPPAYSDIHGSYNGQGSGAQREQSFRIQPADGRRDRQRRQRRRGNCNAGDDDRQFQGASQSHHGHQHDHAHRHGGERGWAPPPPPTHQRPLGDTQLKTQLPPIPADEEESHRGPRNVIPMPTANQIHISDSKHEIKGTFYVDPLIESLDPSRRKSKGKDTPDHASFRTRHQEIDIELGTTGNVERAPKAKVAVYSRTGHIKVKLLAMHPTRPRIGLDVQSRHGDIVMFIPDNYVGVVELSTRKGKLEVLPALASHMKVVKSSEHEMLFMVGDAHENGSTSREASFCDVHSRTGAIIIGMSNRDTYTPRAGFWKRIGALLKGDMSYSEAK